ncbi:MAG: peptidylprolyl isomerase [Nitrospinaceae bacterium]|nr:peptidylprolyl isomerase [Nitrospinaceae bacterium]NIR55810.1 peptidylprolyl isomerase [Nitrospinaceae bacterium]NIS86263.1 peptidylprolyl isomerase [Nitrospinaceae bacterium]NIT83092.1 peptidylprolyl isomerase [Nitrospinaceae bacterium]NIU45302.1 peptidylprolyl isomerase [Nitrospinaceae bacterium]
MRKILFSVGVIFCLSGLLAGPAGADEIAVIETKYGNIEIEFLPDKAPDHVRNFKDLAKTGFYNGTRFHRVIPTFMIQGGDPNSKSPDRRSHGFGGPGYTIPAEFNDVSHKRGILSMARGEKPDTAGSQFFIVVKDSPALDGQYTVFGRVIKGMEVADKIVNQIIDENVKDGVPREIASSGRLRFTNPLDPIHMKVSIKKRK